MVAFFPMSDKAMQEASTPKLRGSFVTKYPWKDLPVGSSFAVDRHTVKLQSMRSQAYKASIRLKMKFIVVDHGVGAFEVARVE